MHSTHLAVFFYFDSVAFELCDAKAKFDERLAR